MRSSTGQHWIALDHVRALAAFMVFTFHFTHGFAGYPVANAGAPAVFPLALVDEGHTGVALFMALSGYLFAKLLSGRAINYTVFFWNRLVRLAPLMIAVTLAGDLQRYLATGHADVLASLAHVIDGFVRPSAPLENGFWSIVVESHFYLALPLLMIWSRRSLWALPLCVAVAIVFRAATFELHGSVKFLAYWTIGGRIDQFLLGIVAFGLRERLRGRHMMATIGGTAFLLFYGWFDAAGGWSDFGDTGLRGAIWIVLPTIEGIAYAGLIAYYDTSFAPRAGGVSGLIAKAGAYSYSIYLLHFFVVFALARFIDTAVMDLSNFYVACGWSALCFAAMVPIGRLCFVLIEQPFLRLREDYTRPMDRNRPVGASATAG